jgi:hypothetical protein
MGQHGVAGRREPGADRGGGIRDRVALRKLPQPAEQALGPAAREQDPVAVGDPQRGAREQRQRVVLLARRQHRQLALPPGRARDARLAQRTHQAGRGRRARRRAELHQALVEIAGRGPAGQGGHHRAGELPDPARARGRLHIEVDREHPREHARDVAVDQRGALAERDRRDRARGVRADPGHVAEVGGGRRDRAGVARDHLGSAAVQVARARVVAEPGPRREHVVERRGGERVHRREPRHPPIPVRDHGRDPGLLQHDLADPDRVRVARPAPWQITARPAVPRDERARDLAGLRRGRRDDRGHARQTMPSRRGKGLPLRGSLGHLYE